MKIGLIDVDSKIPNLALMKLSAWHKTRGDSVQWWNAFEPFDTVYASKIFTQTQNPYIPKHAIRGGGGYNLMTQLSPEIEHIYPDYSLYQIDYAMGYITRGCINRCPFCIIPKKEGSLRFNAPLNEFWHGQSHLMLMDNAITDLRQAWTVLEEIRDLKIYLTLPQGFNIRTIQPECAHILAEIKIWSHSQWHIAWDNYHEKDQVLHGIQILKDAGIPMWKVMCYVLTNFNTTLAQDLDRIQILVDLGIDPFVMIYNRPVASKIYQKLGKWCNRPQIRTKCNFQEYLGDPIPAH
jgi:hypothetical protein